MWCVVLRVERSWLSSEHGRTQPASNTPQPWHYRASHLGPLTARTLAPRAALDKPKFHRNFGQASSLAPGERHYKNGRGAERTLPGQQKPPASGMPSACLRPAASAGREGTALTHPAPAYKKSYGQRRNLWPRIHLKVDKRACARNESTRLPRYGRS